MKTLSGHSFVLKTVDVQILRPAQLVVLAAEGKTSFGSLIEEVTLTEVL